MIGRELEGRRRRGAGRASPPGARGRPSPAAIGAKISLLRQPERYAVLARAGWDMEAESFMRRRRSYPQVYSLTVTQACLN
jgi:hypothetical protein